MPRPEYPSKNALGAALRAFRERTELSQEALADAAGLHRTYVGGVERGERNPSFESITRMLQALGVSWSQLGRALDRRRRA